MVEKVVDKRDADQEKVGTIKGLLESYLFDPEIAEKYLRKLLKQNKESFEQLHTDLTNLINIEGSLDRKIDMQSLNALFVRIENNPEEEEEEE